MTLDMGSQQPAYPTFLLSHLGRLINGYLGKPGKVNCGMTDGILTLCPRAVGSFPPHAQNTWQQRPGQ